MHAQELKCPRCFAPIGPVTGAVATCRYCGATLAIQGAAAAPSPPAPGRMPYVPDVNAPVFLEHAGDNKIAIIKVIRQHTGLGLREAKELCERAPCVVANWPGEPLKMLEFRHALVRSGARVR